MAPSLQKSANVSLTFGFYISLPQMPAIDVTWISLFAGPHGRFLSVAELAAAAAEKLATKVPENIATRSSPIVVAEAQPPQKQPSKEAPAMASSTVTPKAESQPKQYHNEAAPSNAFKLPAYRTSTDDMLAGGTLMVAP